jgi:hypothetical protein
MSKPKKSNHTAAFYINNVTLTHRIPLNAEATATFEVLVPVSRGARISLLEGAIVTRDKDGEVEERVVVCPGGKDVLEHPGLAATVLTSAANFMEKFIATGQVERWAVAPF